LVVADISETVELRRLVSQEPRQVLAAVQVKRARTKVAVRVLRAL
jgi:hypothetical protein